MKEFFKQFLTELPGILREQGKKIIVCLLLICVVGFGIWYSYRNVKIVNAKNQRAVELLKASISERPDNNKKEKGVVKTKKPIKKTKMKKENNNSKKLQKQKEVIQPATKDVVDMPSSSIITITTPPASQLTVLPPVLVPPEDPDTSPIPEEPDLPPLPPSVSEPPPALIEEIVIKNIIINEVHTYGEDSSHQFIELYNPNNKDMDLKGFSLKKKTSTGTESNLVSQGSFSGIIPAGGFFLITPVGYQGAAVSDLNYSGSSYSLAQKDNTVLLYNQDGALADKVGFGNAADAETSPFMCPDQLQCIPKLKSIERETLGQDADNNAEDFQVLDIPTPKSFTSQ